MPELTEVGVSLDGRRLIDADIDVNDGRCSPG